MNELHSAQELARRCNEDEAIWRAFERKRALRRSLVSKTSKSSVSEEALDRLDWEAAERECREVLAIGFFHDAKP